MNIRRDGSPWMMMLALFCVVVFSCRTAAALEIPLEFHGHGLFGKYLNSDTSRFNLDASVEIYCTTLRHGPASAYIYYRDDLDMAKQTGGVSIDPRYAHYYLTAGFDYFMFDHVVTGYFVHDCVHDIDHDVEGTPVFNRFRLRFSHEDFHYSKRLETDRRFLYAIDLGYYPHWTFSGWDINSGADYSFDVIVDAILNMYSNERFGIDVGPSLTVARGDTAFYHRHVLRLQGYYKQNKRRIGLSLDYNLYVNDPIKNPDGLWLLSIYLDF